MNRLDSIKLVLPSESLILNPYFFENRVGKFEQPYKALRDDSKLIGLKDIRSSNDTTTIELSSKILGRDYLFGINKNTTEKLYSNLTDSRIISLSFDSFLSANLVSTDFSTLIPLEDGSKTIKDLSFLALPNHHKNTYKTKRNEGLTISGNQSTFKERMIIYNKYKDLQKASNKDFLASLGHKWVEDSFKGLYRLETNVTDKKTLRRYLCSDKTTLASVLQSKEPVLKKVFQKIVRNGLNPMMNVTQETLAKEIKIRGLKDAITNFDGIYSDFWNWYRHANPNNYRRDKKECLMAYDLYLKETQQTQKKYQINESVNLILNHLEND
jgi:hypothetical protein